MEDQQLPRPQDQVVTADNKLNSRLQKITEQFKKFSKQKYTQLGLVLLLLASVPLTVVISMNQQDIRQQAATSSYKLVDGTTVNSLEEFQTKIKNNPGKNLDGSPRGNANEWPIGYEDYALCPVVSINQPGSPDVPSLVKDFKEFGSYFAGSGVTVEKFLANPQQVIASDLANGQKKTPTTPSLRDIAGDPWYNWGDFVSSKDKSDLFFTDDPANSPARLRGDEEILNRAAHCRDRGCAYYAVWGPDSAWAGGYKYNRSQDTSCFPISTWDCARSGWSKVMGYAQRKVNQLYGETGKLIDRRCALAVAVVEVGTECNSGNESCKNASEVGFSIDKTAVRSSSGGNALQVIKTGDGDKASCGSLDGSKSFTDLGDNTCLKSAIDKLSTPAACTARGYGEGLFAPSNPVSREEFIAFITRYHVYVAKDWQFINVSDTTVLPDSSLFSDVPRNHPHALNIYTAAKNNFTDTTAGKSYDPTAAWRWGYGKNAEKFSGTISKDDYDFTPKVGGKTLTRGEIVIGLYNHSEGKACNGTGNTTPSAAPGVDPSPFVEEGADYKKSADETPEVYRKRVCGEKASLLSGDISSVPVVSVFGEGDNKLIYLFAKGKKEGDGYPVYVRPLATSNNGTFTNLKSNTWVKLHDLKSSTVNKIITLRQSGPSLSAITDTSLIKLLPGKNGTAQSDWSDWGKNDTKLPIQEYRSDSLTNVGNYSYSFIKGNDDRLCVAISAAPGYTTGGGNPSGGGDTPQGDDPVPQPANPSVLYQIAGTYYELDDSLNNLTFIAEPIDNSTKKSYEAKANGQTFTIINVPAGKYSVHLKNQIPSGYSLDFPPKTDNVSSTNSYLVTAGPGCKIQPEYHKGYNDTQCLNNENPIGLLFDFIATEGAPPPSTPGGEPFDVCWNRIKGESNLNEPDAKTACCRANKTAYAEEPACKQVAAADQIPSKPVSLQSCIDTFLNSGETGGAEYAKSLCCKETAHKADPACADPALSLKTDSSKDQGLFQKAWGWFVGLFQ